MGTVRSSLSARLYLFIDAIMIVVYAGTGILFYFWQTSSIPLSSRRLFSGVLLLYAAYRGIMLYKKNKSAGDENKNP